MIQTNSFSLPYYQIVTKSGMFMSIQSYISDIPCIRLSWKPFIKIFLSYYIFFPCYILFYFPLYSLHFPHFLYIYIHTYILYFHFQIITSRTQDAETAGQLLLPVSVDAKWLRNLWNFGYRTVHSNDHIDLYNSCAFQDNCLWLYTKWYSQNHSGNKSLHDYINITADDRRRAQGEYLAIVNPLEKHQLM